MSDVCGYHTFFESGANHIAPTLVGYPYDL